MGDKGDKFRERLYMTIRPNDYPQGQKGKVIKDLLTGNKRMSSIDDLNKLVSERSKYATPEYEKANKEYKNSRYVYESNKTDETGLSLMKVRSKYKSLLEPVNNFGATPIIYKK